MKTSDQLNINVREEVTIHAFQSAGLVRHTRLLAEIARGHLSETNMVAVTTATILMAAAALEALLLEAAFVLQPSLYANRQFRKAGAPEKFMELKGYYSTKAADIWNARKAVAHAEPDNERTRFVGEKLNANGAEWAARCIEKLSTEIWGNEMPSWFSETIKPA